MKKVIDLLDAALSHIDMNHEFIIMDLITKAKKAAIAELEVPPRWYTPEQLDGIQEGAA